MALKICEPAIIELLKTLAGGNVLLMRAPDDQDPPFIIIQRIDGRRWRSLNNPSGIAQATIQIDAYTARYHDTKKLGADIEAILDGFAGQVYHGSAIPQTDFVKINGISLQRDVDILDQTDDPLLYRSSATYLVTYEQN